MRPTATPCPRGHNLLTLFDSICDAGRQKKRYVSVPHSCMRLRCLSTCRTPRSCHVMSDRLPRLLMRVDLVVELKPRRQMGQGGLGVAPIVNCETRTDERSKRLQKKWTMNASIGAIPLPHAHVIGSAVAVGCSKRGGGEATDGSYRDNEADCSRGNARSV